MEVAGVSWGVTAQKQAKTLLHRLWESCLSSLGERVTENRSSLALQRVRHLRQCTSGPVWLSFPSDHGIWAQDVPGFTLKQFYVLWPQGKHIVRLLRRDCSEPREFVVTWPALKSWRCFLGPQQIEAGFCNLKTSIHQRDRSTRAAFSTCWNCILYECDLFGKEQQLLTFRATEMVELTLSLAGTVG